MKKSYRLPVLDKKLSHRRMVQEARCLVKCRRSGVLTPCVYLIDEENARLYTEKMLGGTVKEFLRRALKAGAKREEASVCFRRKADVMMCASLARSSIRTGRSGAGVPDRRHDRAHARCGDRAWRSHDVQHDAQQRDGQGSGAYWAHCRWLLLRSIGC